MKKNYKNFRKSIIIITIQSIALFVIFYILSSANEVTSQTELKLALLAALIVVGSFIVFKSIKAPKHTDAQLST